MHAKSVILTSLCTVLLSAQAGFAEPSRVGDAKLVDGHKFVGWHANYHNANVFLSEDRALLENGICKFFITAQEPNKLIVFEEEDNAYVQMSPQQWFSEECGSAPSKLIKLSNPRKDTLFDIACTRYDCFNKYGEKVGTYWATNALGIDSRLSNAVAEFLGTPINCGLPLKLEFRRTAYKYRYVRADAPKKKGVLYKPAGKTTLAELTPYTDIVPFAFLKSHKLAQRPLNDFILPASAKRAKSINDLIYGESGTITAGSVDLWMSSPMENQKRKTSK